MLDNSRFNECSWLRWAAEDIEDARICILGIVKARIEKGMTQTEFADFMGVSQGMVSKWESEDYNFTIEAIANICEKLDWDMNVELKPKKKTGFSHTKMNLLSCKRHYCGDY